MEFLDLNVIWFILIGVLFAGYAILDGFDLGVGALHLFVKDDMDRRLMINSIGPVWDGNEVWLVTGGGALFAAFPNVYAGVFSGLYNALMLLLAVLIFRAVAIEFRSKKESRRWRRSWDVAFSMSSVFIALLMGVALGNVIQGLPVDDKGDIYISLIQLLNPYALIVGVTTVSLFAMHGSIYSYMKTEGDLQEKIKGWINPLIITFVILYVLTTLTTLMYFPHMTDNLKEYPAFVAVALLNALAIANIPREIHHNRPFRAFLSSCASILALIALFALGIFPNIVLSSLDPAHSLTIYSAASSQKTLSIMLTMALIGIPFVLAYTIGIYWVFRGKVKIDSMSY